MLLVALYNKKKGIIIKYCHEFTFPITAQQTNGLIWKVFTRIDLTPTTYYAIFNDNEIIITSFLPEETIAGHKAHGYKLENITRKCYPYLDFDKIIDSLKYTKLSDPPTMEELRLATLSMMQYYTDIENMIKKEINQFPDL